MANSNLLSVQGVNEHISRLISSVAMDQEYIADKVLPVVPTRSANVTYRKFGNDHLLATTGQDDLRSPGALPNMVDTKYATDEAVLDEHMLGASVDIQELAAADAAGPGGGDAYTQAKLKTAKNRVLIAKEAAAASLLFTAGNYGSLTASNIDFAATGIRKTIHEAQRSVLLATGFLPEDMVLGYTSFVELMNNTDLLGIYQYLGRDREVELADVERFLGVRIKVGKATTQTAAAAGASGTGSFIWTADSAALIYAPSTATQYDASFGWLFQGEYGFGGREFASVIDENKLFTTYGYGQHYKFKQSGLSAGYLWTNTDQ